MDPNWIVAGAAVVAAGATVWYAYAATAQLKVISKQGETADKQLAAIHRQADIAEHQIKHLERPRLIVERRFEPGDPRYIEDGTPPFVRWALVNGGRSPAIIVRESILLRP